MRAEVRRQPIVRHSTRKAIVFAAWGIKRFARACIVHRMLLADPVVYVPSKFYL